MATGDGVNGSSNGHGGRTGNGAREVSRLMTVVAMAALGLTVDLASVRRSGRAVATLVLALTLFSLVLGLVLVKGFGV